MANRVLSILGCTGSIGVNTLEVVQQFPDRFKVAALAAGRNISLLREQIEKYKPRLVSVLDEELANDLGRSLGGSKPEILFGDEGYERVATLPEVDMVVSSMVGAVGLLPTIAAIKAGKHLGLANKETLVIGGEIVMDLAIQNGIRILPIDSEHSAIFQSLQGNHRSSLRRILLTASGGPFFEKSREELAAVTPQAALRHPNWSMGQKITIDSATLMNKGLEVIEAHWLFGVPTEHIDVHIHPESIVHSMVEYIDGSVIAQLGIPDMKIPISYALAYPERLPVQNPPLDLFRLQRLSFYPPDTDRFPCLRLAYEACTRGSTMPAVLNAANEVAVQAFLEKKIGFLEISQVITNVMDRHKPGDKLELAAIIAADGWARQEAQQIVEKK
ncbi:MAG: 1-deoxy-D-xylulose-5-phosphate reductoisomerase [Desulforhabdus sp.]|jgi:1-deoxy-D-xylulose-5-phosphate reductoisomerase|nr:1-deoxy-D-xylulose-5-phosphate reductoisomerase [Desulforhabdus sp.]